jgi:dTDP-glucose 4,6-dehydratase
MVHTSTSEVYGTARIVPIDEEHPLQGQSPYSASKIAADKMVEAFSRSFGLGAVTVRPFNTFGPRQSVRAVIPTIVTQLLRGPRLRLGSLSPTRDLNFVSNTVDGYLLAGSATGAEGETFNFGSGNEVSIGELAERIGRILGVDPDIECEEARYRPAQSEVERLIANSSKAESILGWRPKFGLDEGLTLTCDWFGKNLDKYSGSGYAV